MFTGIIEELGTLEKIEKKRDVYELLIGCSFASELNIGDSVSVNGACLTVVSAAQSVFKVQAVEETWQRTAFRFLKKGDRVNLERALKAGRRIDGHFVTGHVDGVGEVLKVEKKGESAVFLIKVPQSLTPYMAEKGSVAVDGISLTVAGIEDDAIKIAVIPHTFENTTLKYRLPGSKVNIEVDILARYLFSLLNKQSSEDAFKKFLEGGY